MGLYGEKKDYEELVKDNIKKAKLLYNLSDKDRKIVSELLDKRQIIKDKNGIFVELHLKYIDKKIDKISKKY